MKKAFTLVELLIVMGFIALITCIVVEVVQERPVNIFFGTVAREVQSLDNNGNIKYLAIVKKDNGETVTIEVQKIEAFVSMKTGCRYQFAEQHGYLINVIPATQDGQ